MPAMQLQYGDSTMAVDVPDSAIVVGQGTTHDEPAPLSDPVTATRDAIVNPLGSEPLHQRVGPGAKVAIAFPDRVKGGSHETAHRRVTIPLLLEQLGNAGVRDRDITLLCAIGLHRKNYWWEFQEYLGTEVAHRFRGVRLVNHDAEDPDNIIHVGETEGADVVEVNRRVVEADLAISIGHTTGNPYGGYSGGYKMPATGLTTWRSIRCHHRPSSMHRPDFVPISTGSHFRDQLRAIGQKMEGAMPAPFFAVDAVLNARAQQTAVFAGAIPDVEQASWPLARARTEVTVERSADVLVIGMPRSFHYGPGMGSNPILMLQAIGSSVARAAPALRPGFVVICASVCDGWFNDEDFAPYEEVYDRFQRAHEIPDMERYEEEICNRPEHVYGYRFAHAYHPFHAFSMLYMGGVAHQRARAIYVAGAKSPGHARGMGCIPMPDFRSAMRHARRHVGSDPQLLVVPNLSVPAVHLRAEGAG